MGTACPQVAEGVSELAQERARVEVAQVKRPCCSAQTRAAGSTSITPSRDTLRSTTVRIPKSRSIRMSDAIRAAKPAMAVTPEASTAAPVDA